MAQRDLQDAKIVVIETKKQQLTAIVNAYQALGGGMVRNFNSANFADSVVTSSQDTNSQDQSSPDKASPDKASTDKAATDKADIDKADIDKADPAKDSTDRAQPIPVTPADVPPVASSRRANPAFTVSPATFRIVPF